MKGTPVSNAAASSDDLDTQILQAEMRVIERDQRLQRELRSWGERVKHLASPRRLLSSATGPLALAGVAVAGFLGWRTLHSHSPNASGPSAPFATRLRRGGMADLMLRMLPLAWPMLPSRWRTRVSPATASTALGFALPLLGSLFGSRPRRPPPPSMPYVDLGRYGGRWYEVARLPADARAGCAGQPQMHFALDRGVVRITQAYPTRGGDFKVARSVGRVMPGRGNARLQLSSYPAWLRWLPVAWSPCWVFHVDESARDYRVAVVGSPSLGSLRLLARQPVLPADEMAGLVSVVANLGIDVERLEFAQP
jgi:apolipoprotein D and lipocalin family protein